MVDAGVNDLKKAEKLLDNGVSKLIIGTETLQKKSFVADAVRAFRSERVVVSLDLKGDKVLVKLGFDGCGSDPMCLLGTLRGWMFQRLLFWIYRGLAAVKA